MKSEALKIPMVSRFESTTRSPSEDYRTTSNTCSNYLHQYLSNLSELWPIFAWSLDSRWNARTRLETAPALDLEFVVWSIPKAKVLGSSTARVTRSIRQAETFKVNLFSVYLMEASCLGKSSDFLSTPAAHARMQGSNKCISGRFLAISRRMADCDLAML